MAYKSPRDKLDIISKQEFEEGLLERAIELLLAEAAEEAGLVDYEAVNSADQKAREGRIVYDKFDVRPRGL
ncbi:MAG: hypothetical protein N2Z21_05270 [Candidatus Sumerlaeaceae bacterium]|nr:hypothetical protein [Candidatus Sumerlaeaceae bacterium]